MLIAVVVVIVAIVLGIYTHTIGVVFTWLLMIGIIMLASYLIGLLRRIAERKS